MLTNLPGELAASVRVVFRFAFIIMFMYLGFVGTQAKKLSTKLTLLRDGKITVSHAAGWLQGTQIWAPLYRMRKIPDWKWWLLMVFSAL
ncbi:hypothetical protein BAUCODRAFT_36153 [Baudoinia panamericana UAMH 10762]|uniref:Uncharacterized protein n=1 Tax=Baudoinia panamericana (strain UAMH 10762) TaxID=717646 RepID=M2N7U7_BAUPA|nr:uncharacterized protein BAUCODRAFT_36153 [Baudoinia panamericana UAMH 10762]EMC94880.1 hypothetical protein BAUCODRAFT_36153 [Baudoinia panamericana UAMH 10762]